jgi:hypothetical protein
VKSVSGRVCLYQPGGTPRSSELRISCTCTICRSAARAYLDCLRAMAQVPGRDRRQILARTGVAGNIRRRVSRTVRCLPRDRGRNLAMALPTRNQLLFRIHLSVHATGERKSVSIGANRLVAATDAHGSVARYAVPACNGVRSHQIYSPNHC